MRRVEAKHACRRFLPDHVRQHPPPRRELGVAILVRLHDARIDAERGVVDEDALVERREVDAPLDPVGERIERADDVVPVEAEVEGEVVARAGGDADVGNVMPHGDRGDQRLRAVTPRHPDDVGTLPTASSASSQRSSPGPSSSGSILRFLASSGRLKRSAFPPPDLGLMISTPLSAGCSGRACPCAARRTRSLIVTHRVAGDHAEEQQHTNIDASWYFWS